MPRKTTYKIERIGNISVNSEVLAQVRLLLLDPVAGQVRFGAMSSLINRLLTDWVEKQKQDCTEAERLRLGQRI